PGSQRPDRVGRPRVLGRRDGRVRGAVRLWRGRRLALAGRVRSVASGAVVDRPAGALAGGGVDWAPTRGGGGAVGRGGRGVRVVRRRDCPDFSRAGLAPSRRPRSSISSGLVMAGGNRLPAPGVSGRPVHENRNSPPLSGG